MPNKNKLKNRLEQMLLLPDDWNGYGGKPISEAAHDTSQDIINMIPPEVKVSIAPGVIIDGSVSMFSIFEERRVEILVDTDGRITYEIEDFGGESSEGELNLSSSSLRMLLVGRDW